MKDVVIDGSLSRTWTDKTSMELWLSSWKGEEIVLEGSKCPVNIVTLQGETTMVSINTGHQSPSDTASLPRRMETLKAPWKKPTTCNNCSLLQSTQTSNGANQPPFQYKMGLLPQDLSSWSIQLIHHIHIVPNLRMHGAIQSLHLFEWHRVFTYKMSCSATPSTHNQDDTVPVTNQQQCIPSQRAVLRMCAQLSYN